MKTVTFRQWVCNIRVAKYGNNRTALQLYDVDDGSPVATATVNIVAVSDDQFGEIASSLNCDKDRLLFIKNWSENEGLLMDLIEQDIVTLANMTIPSGFVRANVCILNQEE